jgi:hypothetical protein
MHVLHKQMGLLLLRRFVKIKAPPSFGIAVPRKFRFSVVLCLHLSVHSERKNASIFQSKAGLRIFKTKAVYTHQ